jgi:uncharacterized cupin superfamily protein
VIPEAPLEQTENGVVPAGPGWFVLNAREAPWRERPGRGRFCEFESPEDNRADFEQLGVNLTILGPGEPMAMYHHEADQEDFLILAGEASLVIEEQQRALRAWDFVHCPAGTEHVIVGAGDGPCLILAVGARDRSTGPEWGAYPVSQAALRLGAGVEVATTVPAEAYARFPDSSLRPYRPGTLPGG